MPDTLMQQARFQRILVRSVVLPLLVMMALALLLIWQIIHLQDALRRVDRIDQGITQAHETLNLLTLASVFGPALVLGGVLALYSRQGLLSLSRNYERSLEITRRRTEALQQSQEHLETTLRSIGDAEKELRRADEFREQVMDNAIFGVCALDREGRFILANRRMTEILDCRVEELLGQPFARFILAGDLARATETFAQSLKYGIPISSTETHIVRRSGEEAIVVSRWSPLTEDGKVVGLVGTVEDATERKRLENQLLQAQKLESVGRLAGGVAHDFNNLLTAILGFSELALSCSMDARGQECLHIIYEAGEKASDLIRQLLAFAQRQTIEPKVVNLNVLLLNLGKMLRRLIGENIELVIRPQDGLHSVRVDPGQFEQIVVNLVVNARDAMPGGGTITIETDNVTLDSEYACQHEGVLPGEYVLLAVSDTGSGMDEAVRLHVFEPFFTTKEKGRGTGLGLATVYGIVRQAGGHIWLYSEPGEGTTFRIYLPRTTEPLTVPTAVPQWAALPGGTETLLLVEDEPTVRSLAVQVLRSCGYTVLEAVNGEEALQVAYGWEGEIALLITDVVMPQMSGKELGERMQTLNPRMKVLYASGYTENTIVHHGVLEPGVAFLPKPFTPAILAHKVRDALSQAQR